MYVKKLLPLLKQRSKIETSTPEVCRTSNKGMISDWLERVSTSCEERERSRVKYRQTNINRVSERRMEEKMF